MIVATAAGTTPTVKNITAGTRYAAAGMVCIASSTGRRNALEAAIERGDHAERHADGDRDERPPRASATSVSTVGSHSPTSPGTRAATAATVAIRHRPVRAIDDERRSAATPYHGRAST